MPTAEQHEWMQRVFGIKRNLGDSAAADDPDDDVTDAAVSTVENVATTYVDFSIGEVQGAAKVIVPMAEQAAAIAQDLNPQVALFDATQAAYKLGSDEQYRDAAIAKAEALGETALNVAVVAGDAAQTTTQITTDLLVNPVQGAQELASVAGTGAEKLGQAYDRVAAGYEDAAAQGEGAQYVGKLVGAAGAMVGLAAVGDPEAAGGELVTEGLAVTAAPESLALGAELPTLAEDSAAADSALSDAGQFEGPASADAAPKDVSGEPEVDAAEQDSRGPSQPTDDEPTVTDGLDPAAESGEALADDEGVSSQEGAPVTPDDTVEGPVSNDGRDGPDTILDGPPVDDDVPTVTDGVVQDPAAESGEAVAEGDAGVKTQEGAPTDDATPLLEGPPADIDAVVSSASDKVQAMTDEDLAGLANDEKNQLIKDLTAGGEKPTGDAQEALRKVYRSMEPDPAFRAKDDLRMRDAADSLAGDEDLKAAKANWDSLGTQDRVNALKKVVDAQSKAYGITPPEIETYLPEEEPEDGLIENGKFNPRSGKILLNADERNPALQDFDRAVDLVSHENAHVYQQQLVDRFNSGELRPGDDEYEQAAMFAVNGRPGAYIEAESAADVADYEMQPMEQHAFRTGAIFSNVIADVL
jgi:hypothetical protein